MNINLNTHEKYIPIIENAEEELIALCEKRAVGLYGEIPKLISERLAWEINFLKTSNDLALMLIFGRVLQSTEIKPYMISAKGSLSASIASYLLNITKVNPLPPHYRCKCGNYYDFDTAKYNASTGADLPDKSCPMCGGKLIKDGFNLHSSLLFGKNGGQSLHIELSVPKGKQLKITDIIAGMPEVQPVTEFPPDWIRDKSSSQFDLRIIIPKYIDLDDVYSSSHSCLNGDYPFYSFTLHTDESLDWLTAISEISGTGVDEIDFEGTNPSHIVPEIAEDFIVKRRLEYFRYNYPEAFNSVVNFKNSFDGINGCIPNGIKTLSSFFFSECKTLQTATIPDSVVVIDDFAFLGCKNLSSPKIPPSVEKIGDMAFSGCDSLKDLIIPASVREIGNSAFECCDNLEKVTIENGLRKIGNSAFIFCSRLSEVIIPNSVEEIGAGAFEACKALKKLVIPKNTVKIGEYAFALLDNKPQVTLYCEQRSCAEQYAKENYINLCEEVFYEQP